MFEFDGHIVWQSEDGIIWNSVKRKKVFSPFDPTPEIDIIIKSVPVKLRPRKLKVRWAPSLEEDLKNINISEGSQNMGR